MFRTGEAENPRVGAKADAARDVITTEVRTTELLSDARLWRVGTDALSGAELQEDDRLAVRNGRAADRGLQKVLVAAVISALRGGHSTWLVGGRTRSRTKEEVVMDATEAKTALEAAGYVVVKARTYRNLQERVRATETALEWEKESGAATTRWAHDAFTEQRRLADRLTFVYGEARASGCSVEQLAGGF